MYPFSLFAKAANGQAMTPWERSQYKLWQVLGAAVASFVLVNLPTIQQLLTDPGTTDIWYTVRSQLLVPLVIAVILAFLKYHGAKTDVTPLPGQSLKIQTSAGVPPFGSTQVNPMIDPPVAPPPSDPASPMALPVPTNTDTAAA